MSRLGAYYQAQLLDPIGALGQVSAQASLAHEALRSKLMSPSGDYAVWATQEMTGWTPRAPDYNYRAYPVNAAMLREAERDAMGSPVGLVAAIFSSPMPLEVADALFAEGPYTLSHAEVVYRLDDRESVPTPWFLYWGSLSDEGKTDGYGSYEALEQAIARADGSFVFVVPSSRTGQERPHPTARFTSNGGAAAAEQPPPVFVTPNVEQVATAQPGLQQQSKTGPSLLVLGIVGGLGALIGWSLM